METVKVQDALQKTIVVLIQLKTFLLEPYSNSPMFRTLYEQSRFIY
jgi:hypothetical protein